jgi:signal peptide peptidase SppA
VTTNPIMARFAGEPALVEASLTERFESCLTQAAAHEDFAKIEAARTESASAGDFWCQESWTRHYRPYVVKDGILHIPVKGVLLHDFPFALGGWATGYDYIWEAFKRGCGDFVTGAIKGIALVCDTPGGMVAGCFDTVDRMVALKEEVGVPVRGFAHEAAYSAGYAIITVADHIAVSRTGGVGSIGVVTSHVDASGAYEKMGLKITFIHAGKHKVDGNATAPLPDDVKKRIQARIDELYDVFVSCVTRNRGMDEQAVRATEALTFTATQAVSNGLADSIGPFDDAVAAFAVDLDEPSENNGDASMAEAKQTVDQAVHDKAVADARAEGHAVGLTEGAAAAQTRISAILSSEEAQGREAQANHIAFKTSMSSEDAIGMLAASA